MIHYARTSCFNAATTVGLVIYFGILILHPNADACGWLLPYGAGFVQKIRRQNFGSSKKPSPLYSKPPTNTAGAAEEDGYTMNASNDDKSEILRRTAEQLRREIAEFQQQKEFAKQREELAQQQLLQKQEEERLQYSAVLPIAKPDGSEVIERVFFRPWWSKEAEFPSSMIITCEVASLPLGVLLGEHIQLVGAIAVDEILQDDGFGARAGLQVGDLVRACSACRVEMERPTWQLLAGGIGRPKTRRFMYDVDRRPLEEVLEAIRSNRLDPEQRRIILVLERLKSPPSTNEPDDSS